MNTQKRQQATGDFEKSFYKLMNNSIYTVKLKKMLEKGFQYNSFTPKENF